MHIKTLNAPTDSLTEEFDAEELQISEFLKLHVSDEKHAYSDGNVPSEHTSTDAFTFNSQCLKTSQRPLLTPPPHTDRPASVTSILDVVEKVSRENSRSDGDGGEGSGGDRSKKESSELVPSEEGEGDVHAYNKTQEDICVSVKKLNEDKKCCVDSVNGNRCKECEVDGIIPGDVNSDAKDSRQRPQQTEVRGQCVSCFHHPSTTASRDRGSAMFTGRDGLGRGLGRGPLGTPSSLTAAPPLGRPSLGESPMGGARVPPIGGQLTPLAPIAAASRGAPTPLVSVVLA